MPFLRRFTDEAARELSETIDFYNEVKASYEASHWSKGDIVGKIQSFCAEQLQERVRMPGYFPFLKLLNKALAEVIELETTIIAFPPIDWKTAHLSLNEQIDLKRFLNSKQHFLANADDVFAKFATAICNAFGTLVHDLPALPDVAEDEKVDGLLVPLITLMPKPTELVDKIISTVCKTELREVGLFTDLQKLLIDNISYASGIDPSEENPRRPMIIPAESDLEPVELVTSYLAGTPFLDLLLVPVPFEIPFTARFQHQWIVAPPGAGKSTAMQYFIARDLELVSNNEASIVVMESNRDLIKAIEGLKVFAPGEVLGEKLVSIDAEDVEWPVALNLFDIGSGDFAAYSAADREALNNSVLALYEYIFSALLSAEMTSRQSTLFNFTIQLLLVIPSATLDTLIDLMQPGGLKQFAQYLPQLDYDAKRFFDLKFNSKEFDRTKEQVVDRLFAVKRIRTLSRMFSAPRSKLDFFKEMGAGKVILINVPQSLLQEDGVEIVGRFFISMILLAAHKRQLLPKHERLPCFVYIDECQDFIKRDPKIPVILDQARKLNVGLILAHQRLQQLQNYVLDALYGATAIKFAAQVSDSAAHALARDMRTTPEFILNQPPYHFAAFVRGHTPNAISLQMPFVDMNNSERMTRAEEREVRERIRAQYANPASTLQGAAVAPEQTTAPPTPGSTTAASPGAVAVRTARKPAAPKEESDEPGTW